MLTITWILLTIILIYLIKLIIDYRNWMRHFYKYPSYSVTISDVLVYFSGPEAVIKKCKYNLINLINLLHREINQDN